MLTEINVFLRETVYKLRKKLGYKVWILLAIFMYIVIFSAVEIVVYDSFRVFTWDLGIFNQVLGNTLHGRFLFYTVEPMYTKTGCFLGTHFSPILVLVLPFYSIFPTGENLLVISTFVIAIGALPAYGIANFFLRNEKTAVILGVLYLLYPALQGVTLSGFSPESFVPTILLFIVYFLVKADFKKLAIAVPLGLITHEAIIPVIGFVALYGMLHYRTPKSRGFQASLIILVACISYFFLAQYSRAFFGWTGRPSLWHEWALVGATGPADLPFKILQNPIGAWAALTFDGAAKLQYLALLFLPALLLPLLGLRGLVPAFPYLLISLFSSYPLYYSLEGHYGAFVVPFVFLSLIHGLVRLQRRFRLKTFITKVPALTLLVTVIMLITLLPLTYAQYQVFNVDSQKDNVIRSFISRVPQNASILTQSNIFPFVSARPDAYTIAPPTWSIEYARSDAEILQNLSKLDIRYVLLDFSSEASYSSTAYLIYAEFIVPNENRYTLIEARNGVVLFCLGT
jgi:uncharacterized membrane protein